MLSNYKVKFVGAGAPESELELPLVSDASVEELVSEVGNAPLPLCVCRSQFPLTRPFLN